MHFRRPNLCHFPRTVAFVCFYPSGGGGGKELHRSCVGLFREKHRLLRNNRVNTIQWEQPAQSPIHGDCHVHYYNSAYSMVDGGGTNNDSPLHMNIDSNGFYLFAKTATCTECLCNMQQRLYYSIDGPICKKSQNNVNISVDMFTRGGRRGSSQKRKRSTSFLVPIEDKVVNSTVEWRNSFDLRSSL